MQGLQLPVSITSAHASGIMAPSCVAPTLNQFLGAETPLFPTGGPTQTQILIQLIPLQIVSLRPTQKILTPVFSAASRGSSGRRSGHLACEAGEAAHVVIRLCDSVTSPPQRNAIPTSPVPPVTLHSEPVGTTPKNFLPVSNSQKQL